MSRYGFTTGSCSAAAAKAAAYMLLTGKEKTEISIETPKGILYEAKILDIKREENKVSCCVIKDGGDDPDITTGASIYAEVSYVDDDKSKEDKLNDKSNNNELVIIKGGVGVGVVTKPGLDQPVGNAAINSVPRSMICKEVMEVARLCDYNGSLQVVIYVPDGERLAKNTFNERLGIINGISILGTSGIVEPMSSSALLSTIRTELNQRFVLGHEYVSVSPGNYGLNYMKRAFAFDLDKSVKCSNFIGDTINMAKEIGIRGLLLTGHIGKLVKLAGGIFNTHSQYGDCRMELIAACAIGLGVEEKALERILECVVTEDAVDVLEKAGIREQTMNRLMDKIMFNLKKFAGDDLEIECMVYSNRHGLLARSENALHMLDTIKVIYSEEEYEN